MTLEAEPKHFPRMPGQQADVAIGSPTAIVAVFTEIIRERFRPENKLSWAWTPDSGTPDPDETNDPDAPRRLMIEPAFNSGDETRNFRPAIFVDKGPTVPQKVAIANMAGKHLPSGLTGFYTVCDIPIELEVVSDQKAESAIIADTAWFFILAGIAQIRETFGIQDVSEPVLQSTGAFEQDKGAWSTKVTFNIKVEYRWTTKPVGPLLQGIIARYRASGASNLDEYLLEHHIGAK